MADSLTVEGASKPDTAGAAAAEIKPVPVVKKRRALPSFGKLLPFVGPIALFIIWDLVVRAGWIKAILLPTPAATLITLVNGLAG
ncbi:ABC transporter permease, partial [Streptomyces sp. A1136]